MDLKNQNNCPFVDYKYGLRDPFLSFYDWGLQCKQTIQTLKKKILGAFLNTGSCANKNERESRQ